jgi:hypothetical protein
VSFTHPGVARESPFGVLKQFVDGRPVSLARSSPHAVEHGRSLNFHRPVDHELVLGQRLEGGRGKNLKG